MGQKPSFAAAAAAADTNAAAAAATDTNAADADADAKINDKKQVTLEKVLMTFISF